LIIAQPTLSSNPYPLRCPKQKPHPKGNIMAGAPSGQILITDIVERIKEGRLSRQIKKDHWRIVPYELEEVGAGRSVSLPDWKGGALTIALNAEGWHRVQFIYRYSDLRAKLSSDVCFHTCEPVREHDPEGDAKEGWYDAEEVVWREADLTGQDLILDEARQARSFSSMTGSRRCPAASTSSSGP